MYPEYTAGIASVRTNFLTEARRETCIPEKFKDENIDQI